jgi:hypothetical protein
MGVCDEEPDAFCDEFDDFSKKVWNNNCAPPSTKSNFTGTHRLQKMKSTGIGMNANGTGGAVGGGMFYSPDLAA